MGSEIIGLTDWLTTPPGQYLLAWEREQFDQSVSDIFGYHALQLGMPELPALQANRMPHKWLATSSMAGQAGVTEADQSSSPASRTNRLRGAFVTESVALPFAASSLDLLVLPHTLDLSSDPHATLREVERVLVPEGRVVISGMNPASLWGMRQRRAQQPVPALWPR